MQTALVLPVPGPTPAPVVPPLVTSKVPESAPLKSQSKPTRAKSAGADTSASPASPAAIIVFGLDAAGRKHGAQFAGADADIAERAADLMDLYCFPADTEALRELAAKLPVGRLFPASGKALVPFTSAMVYNRLCAATDTPATPRPVKAAGKPADAGSGGGSSKGGGAGGSGAGDPPASRIGAKAPADFTQIGLGSTVLAQGDDAEDEGFYAAKVIATRADDHFVLTWADYPDLPEFSRSRRALGLMHPEVGEAAE